MKLGSKSAASVLAKGAPETVTAFDRFVANVTKGVFGMGVVIGRHMEAETRSFMFLSIVDFLQVRPPFRRSRIVVVCVCVSRLCPRKRRRSPRLPHL